ncbi:signal transduction histidine kinase [Anseongella ginsenosidimutans]|uniref:histidine kinase n=1 Tax=Anseongella ginsenosidimutans TaxID=496056 RepID=A0A4V2UU40_9SPHI|nr:HAMP domain-containing sensor histidine kinase [Anseongella ginsenosidimutans]QEC51656.1 HAMP domain-containing histidine kinase [Anseongella ginsenosidimutans]TCS88993.1 signal transduction histidine kinase [Anseongella ginsenosidimutans]
MGRSKNTLTLSMMSGSIILVLVLQGFWLKSSYKNAVEQFDRETGFLFRTTVMSLQDSLIRENIEMISADSLPVPSLPAPGRSDTVFPRTFSRSVLNTVPDSATISIIVSSAKRRGNAAFARLPEDRVSDYKDSVTSYFILREADSLRIRDIEKEYRAVLDEAGIYIPFKVIKTPFDTLMSDTKALFPPRTLYLGRKEEAGEQIKSHLPAIPGWRKDSPRFITHHEDERLPRAEHVFLPQTGIVSVQFEKAASRWLLLGELAPQLLFSLVMILFIGISFYFMYRSLRMQQRLMLLKNDFVSNMTHELKTPVATASVAIEALRSFRTLDDPERTHEYLEIAQHELNRLTLLTDNILKAAIFESKGIAIHIETFELKEVVAQVLASMKLVFEKKRASVTFHAEGDDFRARGGKAHIVNLFYNLLDNALKYSPGEPEISVRLKCVKDGVLLNIRDKGIGIPPEFHKKVFEKFFRVPSGNVHNIKGHGLGLNYVAGVVKSHGGTIRLDSQPGKGSTFIVYLPKHYEKN